MRRWLHMLLSRAAQALAASAKAEESPAPAAAPNSREWRTAHRDGLYAFLFRTEAGMVLMHRFRAVAAQVSARSCADAFHTSHSAGTAHGWNEALAWLESLSRTSRDIDVPSPEANQA